MRNARECDHQRGRNAAASKERPISATIATMAMTVRRSHIRPLPSSHASALRIHSGRFTRRVAVGVTQPLTNGFLCASPPPPWCCARWAPASSLRSCSSDARGANATHPTAAALLRVDSTCPRGSRPARKVASTGSPARTNASSSSAGRTLARATSGPLGRFLLRFRAPEPGRYRLSIIAPDRIAPVGALLVRPLVLDAVGDVTFGEQVGPAVSTYGGGLPVEGRRANAARRRRHRRQPRDVGQHTRRRRGRSSTRSAGRRRPSRRWRGSPASTCSPSRTTTPATTARTRSSTRSAMCAAPA